MAPRLRHIACAVLLLSATGFSPVALAQAASTGTQAFTVTRFNVTGDNPLSDDRTQEVLRPYLGKQDGLGGLEAATNALQNAMRLDGFGLYRAVIPPQETVDVIEIRVVRFPVKSINVLGQKYFDEANIRASVPSLQIGGTPTMQNVARELAIANDNPSKRTALEIKESETEDGIEATLNTSDSNPLSFAAGLNNSGSTDSGGRTRLVAFLQYANLFNLDQVLGVAYTTAPEHTGDVRQYGLFYKAPIYSLGGVVSASSSYSSVNSGALGSGQVITGAGTTNGVSYTQYLRSSGNFKSSIAAGLDDKIFRAPVIAGIVSPTGDVRSRPVSLTYVGVLQRPDINVSFNLEYDRNINGGAHNDLASYSSNRLGASNDWETFRGGYSLIAPLFKGFSLVASLRGQYSHGPLISGEQFGLGGSSSVRGAPERAITGDHGFSNQLEIYTPELWTNLRLLAFIDSGTVKRYQPQPGETPTSAIQGAGFGLRWSWKQSASLSLDYGRITNGSHYPVIPTGSSRVYASFLYRY